jgi:hypothetical protein
MTFALVIVGLLAAWMGWAFVGYPEARLQSGRFSAKEQHVLACAADTMFPPGGPIALSGTEAGVVEYMDEYLARSDRRTGVLLRLLVHFVEHAPWIFGPKHVRLTQLTPDEARAYLKHMERNDLYFLRVSFTSLRALFTMGYLAHPRVAEAMGIRQLARPFERAGASEAAS